jgi:hypothetical protein
MKYIEPDITDSIDELNIKTRAKCHGSNVDQQTELLKLLFHIIQLQLHF